jgi:hypothetical protein
MNLLLGEVSTYGKGKKYKKYSICSFGYFPGVEYPKEHIQYSNHGESLKSTIKNIIHLLIYYRRNTTESYNSLL